MLRFALRRTAQALPLILGVATLMFLLIHLAPGDAADAMVGEYPVSPEYMASVRERYGLDKSLPEQFIAYLGQLAGEIWERRSPTVPRFSTSSSTGWGTPSSWRRPA